ncbi:hypothetical protein D0T11_11190 [Hymenobacter rubripertinctus]|uniref:STAS domain-containing protein n=1 Tax=Hymenobacter rubripertinctus TaxID=2029981 RepID=A0A418QX66_9BACT|nr:hypothetical protein D0T11_11190 [Hymenobacter rubripertinctus]
MPNAYLLVLSPSNGSGQERQLIRALHRASRTDKPAILLDFSLVDMLSDEAIDLLLAYAFVLHAQGRRLILCYVPPPVRHRFLHLDAASRPLLVPSLLDAMAEINFPARHNPAG